MNMLNKEDTITIINALKISKQIIHEAPIIQLTENADTLSVERIDRVIDGLTDDWAEVGLNGKQ